MHILPPEELIDNDDGKFYPPGSYTRKIDGLPTVNGLPTVTRKTLFGNFKKGGTKKYKKRRKIKSKKVIR